MDETIFEELDVKRLALTGGAIRLEDDRKPVISEISLKVYVNGMELVSMLCMNRQQEELALGFLYSEGVINGLEDVEEVFYNDMAMAVMIKLKDGVSVRRQESLRSMTSGCGKCYTYINPLKRSQYKALEAGGTISASAILYKMQDFIKQSEVFRQIGGVHSLLLDTPDGSVFSEDIGRHNCFDKVTGVLLKAGKLACAQRGVVYISGRVSSEIMTKAIRLGAPVVVSKSTPTTSAVKLAKDYNVTLIGYARDDSACIYSGVERIAAV